MTEKRTIALVGARGMLAGMVLRLLGKGKGRNCFP